MRVSPEMVERAVEVHLREIMDAPDTTHPGASKRIAYSAMREALRAGVEHVEWCEGTVYCVPREEILPSAGPGNCAPCEGPHRAVYVGEDIRP